MKHLIATLAAAAAGVALATPSHAAQPRTEYLPCGQEALPTDCVMEPHATGSDGIVYIGEGHRIWRLPHHIAHRLIYGVELREYVPCGQEDDLDCVWDARHRGNGMGRSFYVGVYGQQWDLPHHIAHYLLGLPTQPA